MRMKSTSTKNTRAKKAAGKVTPRMRELYEQAKREAADHEDPEAPILAPEKWGMVW